MLRDILRIAAGSLIVLAGCHRETLAPNPRPAPPELPVALRGAVEPDVSAVAVEPLPNPPVRPARYALLTARECASLAIEHEPVASELIEHPGDSTYCKRDSEEAKLSHTVRCYAADDLRNRAAGDALEMYFKLASAEGQFDLVATGDALLRTQLAAAIKAEEEGLRDRGDVQALRRQLLDAESQSAKLRATITVLNVGLREKLGLDPAAEEPLWPADPLRVRPTDLPVGEAIATGLYYRPDLSLLRVLDKSGNNGGKLANDILKSVNPLLGSADPSIPLVAFLKSIKKHPIRTAAITGQEIEDLLAIRERQAAGEIESEAAVERGARAAIAAKVAEERHSAARVAELQKKVAAGIAGANADLVTAKLDQLKVKGELLSAVAEWHIADAKLRQAMGMLVRE